MNNLENLVSGKANSYMTPDDPDDAIGQLMERQNIGKNYCARVVPELANRIDFVTASLGVSKRQFFESALIDAVASAERIMDETGMMAELMAGVTVKDGGTK